MNITEANAAQTVIGWLTGLVLAEDETHADLTRRVVSDDRLVQAVTLLADRSSERLGAGMRGDEAARRMGLLLLEVSDGPDSPPAALADDPEAYRDDQDDEDAFARAEAGF